MSITRSTAKRLLVSFLTLTLLVQLNLPTFARISAQDTSFTLQRTESGFYGTYAVGGVEYLYNTNRQQQLHESYIQKSHRRNIASCVLYKDRLTITLGGVAIEFNMSDQTMSPLSEAELASLRAFSTGADAAIAREVIRQIVSSEENLSNLSQFGFIVLGMLLGDESLEARNVPRSTPNRPVNKEPLSQLIKVKLAHAFENSPRKAELLRKCKQQTVAANVKGRGRSALKVTPRGPCHGCCGSGCWGCTGIYTPACHVHDNCVAQYGYWDPRCLALLVAALHSFHQQTVCPLCT